MEVPKLMFRPRWALNSRAMRDGEDGRRANLIRLLRVQALHADTIRNVSGHELTGTDMRRLSLTDRRSLMLAQSS